MQKDLKKLIDYCFYQEKKDFEETFYNNVPSEIEDLSLDSDKQSFLIAINFIEKNEDVFMIDHIFYNILQIIKNNNFNK